MEKNAGFDVSVLTPRSKVGARYKGAFAVHSNTFGVEATPRWTGFQGSLVAVEIREWSSKGPVIFQEGLQCRLTVCFGICLGGFGLGNVHEEVGLDVALLHGGVKRAQDVRGVLEA